MDGKATLNHALVLFYALGPRLARLSYRFGACDDLHDRYSEKTHSEHNNVKHPMSFIWAPVASYS
jgi:hypothetical protein